MKRKILFIINPISGGKDKKDFPNLVSRHLDLNLFEPHFELTNSGGHAFSLAGEASAAGIDAVVAVGGDGTINEIASALEGTQTVMGIIPYGSGNGLARSLHISLNNVKAIAALNKFDIETIDSAELDGGKFFNMAGVGFDARISYLFATIPNRGFKGYAKATINEIFSYKSKIYELEIDGKKIEREAFMISLANSAQYGNNAYIAPTASLKDGLLDVCIVKPFPLYMFPSMIYHLFNKSSEKSKYVEIIKGKNIRIKTDKPEVIHLDGEPRMAPAEVIAKIKPLALKVLH